MQKQNATSLGIILFLGSISASCMLTTCSSCKVGLTQQHKIFHPIIKSDLIVVVVVVDVFFMLFQTTWERSTDRKIERNTVQRRVEGLLQQREYSLQERRDK